MHPELLNNSLFLRYYQSWQEDPSSIVFAPIAEFFLRYNMIEEALEVCQVGMQRHPHLVSGRLVLAKTYVACENWAKALDELQQVLTDNPHHVEAMELVRKIDHKLNTKPELASRVRKVEEPIAVAQLEEAKVEPIPPRKVAQPAQTLRREKKAIVSSAEPVAPVKPESFQEEFLPESWQTVTMAQIFAKQGHKTRAKQIYKTILQSSPDNEAARTGLAQID